MLDTLWQDLRYALRSLRRRPLITAVGILSLALGIGVNTAIFSVFDQQVLRQLPVPDAGELVLVTSPGPKTGNISSEGDPEGVFSYALARDLERLDGTGLSHLGAYRDFDANVAYHADSAPASGLLVSGGYFPALGVAPALGRLLTQQDDRTRDADKVVVLDHDYWSTRFGGRRDIVNDVLLVNGEPLTIIGVAPDGFSGTTIMDRPQVYVPLSMAARMRPGWTGMESRVDHWIYLFGRLQRGTTRAQAETSMSGVFNAILRDVEFPEVRSRMNARAGEQFLTRRIVLEEGARGRKPDER
jgi:hypothetical protein